MLSYTDLKKGTLFVMNGEPHEIVESSFSRMQQRKAVVRAKIRNLVSGKIIDQGFQPSDQFKEADIEKRPLIFLFHHRGVYTFSDSTDKGRRMSMGEKDLGEKAKWLKTNTEVTALFFDGKLISFLLPVKMEFRVIEAAPGVQGDRSQGGTKPVTLETGSVIQVPLFINQGDTVRINTETGAYAERAEKA